MELCVILGIDLEEEKEHIPVERIPEMTDANIPSHDIMDLLRMGKYEMEEDMDDIANMQKFENFSRSIAEKKRYNMTPLII